MKLNRTTGYATVAAAGLTALWASLGTVGAVFCLLAAGVFWLQLFAEAGFGG